MFQLELHIPLTVVAAAASLTHQPELAFFDGHHDGFRKVYSVWLYSVGGVPCSTATFAVAILSSLCVEITEPLVRVWRHVRDHAQQVEGEHLVEDDSLLVQTILAQPGRGQQQQLNIFLESLPERILSRAFFAIVLMTRSRCLITAGGLSGWIVTGSKGRSSASAGGDSSSETSGPAACAGRRLEALVRYTLLNAARSRGAAERYRLRPSGWGFKAAIRPYICSTTLATHHRQQQQPPVLLRLCVCVVSIPTYVEVAAAQRLRSSAASFTTKPESIRELE